MKKTFLTLLLALPPLTTLADGAPPSGPLDAAAIDQVVARAMSTFDVPGMAVGVIKDGEVRYVAGHGVREISRPERVNTDTLFRVASVTKAFTAAAVAVLVDEGRLSWNGPVNEQLPELRFNDPWVTANISLVDLLAHRSGLAPFTGDLMLWPVPNAFTEEDIIHALRYFPLDRGFRAGYTYDNVLYIVTGEVIERSSGLDWGTFVDQRIMAPLGMDRCFAGAIPATEMENLAAPHGEVEGRQVVIERNRIPSQPDKFSPAGGIACSVTDMLKWLALQLGRGTAPDGTRLFSEQQAHAMWAPHNWLGVGSEAREVHNTNFRAYGLGWRSRDVQGEREVSHTGSLDGWRAQVAMLPDQQLGIVVLANGASTDARNAVIDSIEYGYLPRGQRDWVAHYSRPDAQTDEDAHDVPTEVRPQAIPARELDTYTGRFTDPWFGDIVITRTDDGLHFSSAKAFKLNGPLQHHSGDLFLAQWEDRSVGMDAWVRFEVSPTGRVTGIRMNRNFEAGGTVDYFRELNFTPVNEP